MADLSQRDLAQVLEVSQSMVARWELGGALTAQEFMRILDVAGLGLLVVQLTAEGRSTASAPLNVVHTEVRDSPTASEVEGPPGGAEPLPMRPDGVRDAAGRRFPSHLDVRVTPAVATAWGRRERDVSCPHRPWRDHLRWKAGDVPADHPTSDEVLAQVWQLRRERAAALEGVQRRIAGLARLDPLEPVRPCFCPDSCAESALCPPDCPCGCEARLDPWATRSPGFYWAA